MSNSSYTYTDHSRRLQGEDVVEQDDAAQVGQNLRLASPLRAYQWDGVRFLVRSPAALLADEMGLGKTVQTITASRVLLERADTNRVLVVAPAALRLNWYREIERWAPEHSSLQINGNARSRLLAYDLPVIYTIASYEQLRIDAPSFSSAHQFDLAIFDEAQRLKNIDSRTALAARLVTAKRIWALTGTPVENAPSDLVSIFAILCPGLLDGTMLTSELQQRIQPFTLRRRKQDVLPDLPEIMTQDMPITLGVVQRRAYSAVWNTRQQVAQRFGKPIPPIPLLAMITRLKQLCNYDEVSGESAKWEAVRVLLESVVQSADKVIIFSQYVRTLLWLQRRLGQANFAPIHLFHGAMTGDARDEALRHFEESPGPRILLISLRAGGVGLNLNAAGVVIMFDRWWNPAVESQAIHRAHRFGRNRPLHVVRFVTAGTIEERIDQILARKTALFDEVVDSAPALDIPPFTRQELADILGLDEASVPEKPDVSACDGGHE